MEILETLLDIGIDMLDGFALLYLCRSMLKECRIKRAAVYYLFVLPIAAVIFAFNHYFPTVGGMVVTLLFMLATVLALFRDKIAVSHIVVLRGAGAAVCHRHYGE